jgi:superfamily I DNA/RNA helicase
MELSIVISQMGLRGARSHRTYEAMVDTWIDPNEPIPTLEQCQAKWNELQASGFFEPPYYIKRSQAYEAAGLSMAKVNELTNEYTQALAANNVQAIGKYQSQLIEVFAKRQEIKQLYPKP